MSFLKDLKVPEPLPAMLRNLWMKPPPSWDAAKQAGEERLERD